MLENEERRAKEELTSKNNKVENELETSEEAIVRLERVVQGYETSRGKKRGKA